MRVVGSRRKEAQSRPVQRTRSPSRGTRLRVLQMQKRVGEGGKNPQPTSWCVRADNSKSIGRKRETLRAVVPRTVLETSVLEDMGPIDPQRYTYQLKGVRKDRGDSTDLTSWARILWTLVARFVPYGEPAPFDNLSSVVRMRCFVGTWCRCAHDQRSSVWRASS